MDHARERTTIIHAADLHLGSRLRGLEAHETLPVDEIRAAPLAAFERLADLCAQRRADLLVIAGDLFDGDATIAVMADAIRVLQRIAAGGDGLPGTQVVFIRGNHDAASHMRRRMPRMEGVRELSVERAETVTYELGHGEKVAVHGRGFATKHVPDRIVGEYPARVADAFNVGVLHTSLEGNAAHAAYAPCSLDDLAAHGYDYWALGHIHQHAIVRAADPVVAYAGSPQGRHVNERGAAFGAYVLEVEGGRLVREPEHVPLAVLAWHRVEVDLGSEGAALDAGAGVEDVAGAVREAVATTVADVDEAHELQHHVVRVVLRGRTAVHGVIAADPDAVRDAIRLEAEVLSRAGARVHVEQVKVRTRPVLPDAAVLRERVDAIGELHRDVEQLDAGALEVPPVLAAVETRLKKLGAAGEAGDEVRAAASAPIDDRELRDAVEELLGRLVEEVEG